MKSVVRLRVILAICCLAAVMLAAAPHGTLAASPHVKTGTYQLGSVCTHSDGENYCSFKSGGGDYNLLSVAGSGFEAHGDVRLIIVINNTNHILVDTELEASASGKFTFKSKKIEPCSGGKKLAIMAIDQDTDTLSNVAFVTACHY